MGKLRQGSAGDLWHLAIQRLLSENQEFLRRCGIQRHEPLRFLESAGHSQCGIQEPNTPVHSRRLRAKHLGHLKKLRGLLDLALRHRRIKFRHLLPRTQSFELAVNLGSHDQAHDC